MNIKYSLVFMSILFTMIAYGMTQDRRERAQQLVADARKSVQAGLQAGRTIAAQNETMSTAVQQLPTPAQVAQFEADSTLAATEQSGEQPIVEQESRFQYVLHNPWAWLSIGTAASIIAYLFGKRGSRSGTTEYIDRYVFLS